jgi:hypothetical protein
MEQLFLSERRLVFNDCRLMHKSRASLLMTNRVGYEISFTVSAPDYATIIAVGSQDGIGDKQVTMHPALYGDAPFLLRHGQSVKLDVTVIPRRQEFETIRGGCGPFKGEILVRRTNFSQMVPLRAF